MGNYHYWVAGNVCWGGLRVNHNVAVCYFDLVSRLAPEKFQLTTTLSYGLWTFACPA